VLYLVVIYFLFFHASEKLKNDQKRLSQVVGCFFVATVSSALSFGEK